MRIKIIVCMVLFIFNLSAAAVVKDISSVDEININNPSQNDLIVFDLDNTIIQAKQSLASDQWFRGYWSRLKSQGLSDDKILEEIIPVYNAAQNVTDVQIVEDSVVGLINNFKTSGAHVIGLTARNHELITPTSRHLKSVDVTFESSEKYSHLINDVPVFISNGVIYANGQNKGDCLQEYISKHNMHPQRIVFIDDSLNNVINVKTFADKNNIDFIGYRYGYLDQKVMQFDMNIADVQLEKLKIISDEHARQHFS